MSSGDQVEEPITTEESGGKSFFGKLKAKAKGTTSKIKSKTQKTGTGGEALPTQDDASSSSSSSDEEDDAPAKNLVKPGVTQPQYEDYLERGATPGTESEGQTKAAVPSSNFPGDFGGVVEPSSKEVEEKEDDSGLSKDFAGLSTGEEEGESDKPVSEKVSEGATDVKSKVADKGSEAAEKVSSASEEVSPGSTNDADKTWGQWAAEKVGYAKETADKNLPTTQEGKPIHEAALEKVNANIPTTEDGKPIHHAAIDKVSDEVAAAKDGSVDPSQQTYVQKATSGLYAAKDSLFSSTQPGDHDKALSQKVTEAVGNFPSSIASSLGYGGASSPTTTPAVKDSLKSLQQEGSSENVESPGIVGRFTSIFAAAPKKAEEATDTAAAKAEETSKTET